MIRIIQSLSVRERVMLLAFIIVCLLIWASSLSKRWEASGEVLREARKTVKQQEIWLKSEPLFQAQLEQTLARLDADKMLNGRELTALVDSYAREHQLKHDIGALQDKKGSVYSRATITVSFRNISLKDLVELQLHLDKQRPYVAVEGMAITANRTDPRLLNAKLRLTSLSVNSPAPTPAR